MPSQTTLPVAEPAATAPVSRRHLFACVLAMAAGTVAPLAVVASAPAGEVPHAVFFPPWLEREAALDACLAAEWTVLRSGIWPNVVVAQAPSGGTRPAAAWFAVALDGLGGCLDGPASRTAA